MFNKEYNLLVKFLHHIVLGNRFVPELLFDLENLFYKKKRQLTEIKQILYITGLARSGTTILMRSFYNTNEFASFTYKDMPFIICPNIWNNLSKYLKPGEAKVRKHHDNIKINLDSPEEFEEVFWILKNKAKYIFQDYLDSYTVSKSDLDLYESFILNCLVKYKKNRYLCKNNNNIIRIDSIINKFPASFFLILIRNPIHQSISLFNQHQNFLKQQKEQKFILSYMNYLGHHEFGANHKVFKFDDNNIFNFKTSDINYWLENWINYYQHVYNKKYKNFKNVMIINYDDLCNQPDKILQTISSKLNIDILSDLEKKYFKQKNYLEEDFTFDKSLKEKSTKLFKDLIT
jgi:hypothetical protein